jgi:glycosyltransferase involved in cell wall biosynthesis
MHLVKRFKQKSKKNTVSILIPTYNGASTIKETLDNIIKQKLKNNFSIIIQDDASTDNTLSIIKSFKDPRIKIFRNKKNLGCQKNMNKGIQKIDSDIIFFMAQDDILGRDALQKTYNAFLISSDIGLVTRPYFWFDTDINKPVRITGEINPLKNTIVSMKSDYKKIITIIDSIGQISGVAYRTKYFCMPIHEDIFPGHAYLFASIMKNHKTVFLKDYTVAVRIQTSQSRKFSHIYDMSPIQSWVNFCNNVFYENRYAHFRKYLISNYIATNYVGLFQIRNYSKYSYVVREIILLIKYRWKNIFNPQLITISLICLLVPPFILSRFVDWYKANIHARIIKKIKFEYVPK